MLWSVPLLTRRRTSFGLFQCRRECLRQPARLIAEEAAESEGRIQFDRNRGVGMRHEMCDAYTIEYWTFMEPADRLLATKHEAGDSGLLLVMLSEALIHADAAMDGAAAARAAPERMLPVLGAAAVAFFIVQAADDVDLVLERRQRFEAVAEPGVAALTAGSPVRRADAADEKAGEPGLRRRICRARGLRAFWARIWADSSHGKPRLH
ncbi:MAG: hypothetical protein U0744_21970 [Gemmataceae bacterium]